jgi:xanthine dehydrogenase accessory factor
MKEITTILEAYSQKPANSSCALAIVIRVEGSSYRRTGARMLVFDDGTWQGGISGGCLEGDALKRAKLAIYSKQPSTITYDTSQANDHQIGIGLGCNGIIEILFCPIHDSNPNNPIAILQRCVQANTSPQVLITAIATTGSQQAFAPGHTVWLQQSSNLSSFGAYAPALQQIANTQLQKGHSAPHTLQLDQQHSAQFFVEILPPQVHLLLFGFQYDVYPLTKQAKELGYAVTIVANPLKVNPLVKNLANNILPIQELQSITISKHTAAILMSHDYPTDLQNLQHCLQLPLRYIGLLGPKVRSQKIFDQLASQHKPLSAADMKRIYAPVGLDIGAQSPDEIALSVLAEIRAVFSGRNGSQLRLRSSSINDRH